MLNGKKIYLRLLEQDDIQKLKDICDEENVKKYNIISDDDKEKEKVTLRKAFSIINKDNTLIGFITYKENIYNMGLYILGIKIGSKYWNRGYGQEYIKVFLNYLFNELNAYKVELEVMKNNIRAITCYKKCGFIEEMIKKSKNSLDHKYVDTIIMGITKDDFIKYEKKRKGE